MTRSKELGKGQLGRIFGVFVLVALLIIVFNLFANALQLVLPPQRWCRQERTSEIMVRGLSTGQLLDQRSRRQLLGILVAATRPSA